MVVVHHTGKHRQRTPKFRHLTLWLADCGMTYVTNDDIRNDLKHDHGDMSAEIDALVLPSISEYVFYPLFPKDQH